ncbi:hypothetical protein [Bacillus thuringiensis]|uniref:hypothetical protein n=1 Tax=Bacillus thuringiensis TaxID=1428 RepID=UPI0020FFFD11|nr:hypothetical protein [Bacillus thuringiensis]
MKIKMEFDMVNYKRMREEIGKLKNKNDMIALAKVHYRKLTRADRAKIFNEVIQDRQTNLEKFKFSLRLSIELSCIFISYKTNLVRVFSKHKFSLAEEIEGKDATQIRERHFKAVIVKACKQCQRGKEYLLNNKIAIYYNSNKKKGRKEVLEVNNTIHKKIFKIVVVLDEYLDLAELSNRCLEKNTKIHG